MNIVELGKTANRALVDRFCRQRIVFHHVPKCGGTSAGRSLRRAYLLSQATVTPEESLKAYTAASGGAPGRTSIHGELAFREMMLLYWLYSDVRCVSAHVPFSNAAHGAFEGKYLFVTLLREPVDRFLSHYFWSHGRPEGHGHIPEKLEDFLSMDRARAMGSTFVRYFCGRPNTTDEPLSVLKDAAKENLRRLDYVGFLDDMPGFQRSLRQLTGRNLKVGHENAARGSSNRNEILQGPLRDRIMEVCAADLEIWESVQFLRTQTKNNGSAIQTSATGR